MIKIQAVRTADINQKIVIKQMCQRLKKKSASALQCNASD